MHTTFYKFDLILSIPLFTLEDAVLARNQLGELTVLPDPYLT